MKTWHKEIIFVSLIMLFLWIFNNKSTIELFGSIAVVLTFCHLQVSIRLEEKNKASPNKYHLECGRWQTYYLVLKEMMWCLYFVGLGAWSALVGVSIFLFYPTWRKYHVSNPA